MRHDRSLRVPGFATLALLAAASASRAGDAYSFTVNQPQSSLTYNFSAASPFTGTMTGDPAAVPPSRLKQGTSSTSMLPFCVLVGSCSSIPLLTNDLLNISGSLAATAATNPSSPVLPGGSFALDINTSANTASARGLNLNLISSGAIALTTNLNSLTYPPFCAATGDSTTPFCTLPFCGAIGLPITGVSLTGFAVVQNPGVATGTLTPTGNPNVFDFSIPMTVTITPTVLFNGAPIATDAQSAPIVLAGTLTRSGNTASLAASTTITFNPPPNTTPTTFPPTPFAIPAGSPACVGLNLLLSTTTTGSTVTSTSTANLLAGGPRLLCPCDFNHDGSRTVQDIFDFLAAWFAGNPAADFNGNGVTVQDIFDFLACWFSGGFSC